MYAYIYTPTCIHTYIYTHIYLHTPTYLLTSPNTPYMVLTITYFSVYMSYCCIFWSFLVTISSCGSSGPRTERHHSRRSDSLKPLALTDGGPAHRSFICVVCGPSILCWSHTRLLGIVPPVCVTQCLMVLPTPLSILLAPWLLSPVSVDNHDLPGSLFTLPG